MLSERCVHGGSSTQLNLHLKNNLSPENLATIEVNLKNGGRWTAIGEPSHVNSITFASRGALDLSQVTLPEPEPETEPEEETDSTSGNTDRSARMLRVAALTAEPTATDTTATEPTTVTPTPASLVTNS